MQPLIVHRGTIIPLNRANIDTDILLPKQYLKSLESYGFGGFLFDDERYLDPGEIDTPMESRRENPNFILNQPLYRSGTVVLAQLTLAVVPAVSMRCGHCVILVCVW